jgi:2-oxoglutarate ferredoxin oxidoreductase subunit alpha
MSNINDFVINIATVNGSGSQSANNILLKTLFRMGIPVGGKNVFPSNIQGLPTWFWIRASAKGYVGRREHADICVAMNPQTALEDQKVLKKGGVLLFNSSMKIVAPKFREDITVVQVPVSAIVDSATNQGKIKKLLANVVYVGVLAELLQIDLTVLEKTLSDQFGGKASVIEVNKAAMQAGIKYAQENFQDLKQNFPFKAQTISGGTHGKIMIEGNAAAALGLVAGGASFAAWYPITPSSSLVENFSKYVHQLREKTEDGKNRYAVVQGEDELSSICMVLGAGWAGARAFTATSGPGLSLMQEASGYAYYTEIPSVIWDVQRVGPSTGMPTRTAQADLMMAHFSSHGDTQHPVLIPGTAKECFEFGQTCFDLAERLQTLVFVLSDLDLGMNFWLEDEFQMSTTPYDRGNVLDESKLKELAAAGKSYFRYQDDDGDGVAARTLPGTRHPLAGYVVRGSGHGSKAQYTERGDEYLDVVNRLKVKLETARKIMPKPVIAKTKSKIAILYYGSAEGVILETRDLLKAQGFETSSLRVRSLPLALEVKIFISEFDMTYVLDLNRDAQMHKMILMEWPELHGKMKSVCHYDGTPVTADLLCEKLSEGKV